MLFDKANSKAVIRESMNTSEVGHGITKLINEFLANRKRVRNIFFINAVISIIIPQTLFQFVLCWFGQQDEIFLGEIIINTFTIPGLFAFLCFMVILCVLQFQLYRRFKKDYYVDERGNQIMKTESPYGDAHWQFEEERCKCFHMEKKVEDIFENILGIDENKRLYGLKTDIKSVNNNKVIFGPPGTAKSVAYIKNDIYQSIRRGDSCIVGDTKGDLYAQTAPIARKYGYLIRVFNLKARELKNSDGCHFIKNLHGDDADSNAETISNAIINNTGDGRRDYFADNEMNLLKALLLFVANDPALIRAGRNKLGEIYDIISTNNADTLEEMFMDLPDDDSAKQAFNIFNNCEPKIKGQIINGLGIRLGLMSNRYVKKICSEDEIDLVLPMKQRCMYYIIVSDTDTSYSFLSSLFFTMAFIEQCAYSDSLTEKEKEKQLCVNYIIDETKNMGIIPTFDQKISTARSRKISITTSFQSIGQMMNMWPENLWEAVLGCNFLKILLRAGDESTAEYFQNMLGTQTIRINQKRYSKHAADIVEGPPGFQTTEGFGTRNLMNINELMELDADEVVIVVAGAKPIKLKKFFSFNHPMEKEAKKNGIKQVRPNAHVPKWRRRMEKEQLERTAKQSEESSVYRKSLEDIGSLEHVRSDKKVSKKKEKQDREASISLKEDAIEDTDGYIQDDESARPSRKKGRPISAKDQKGLENF